MWVPYIFSDDLALALYKVRLLTEGMSDSLFVTTTILESLSHKRRNRSTEFPESGYCPAISRSLSVNVYKTNRFSEKLNI